MSAAPRISTRPPEITQQIKRAALLYRTHHWTFPIIIHRKASIIRNRCTCIPDHRQMLSICSPERSSPRPSSSRTKCATKFWHATRSLIWLNQHRIQVMTLLLQFCEYYFNCALILGRRSEWNRQLPFTGAAGTTCFAPEIAASVVHVQSHTHFNWIQILSSKIAR